MVDINEALQDVNSEGGYLVPDEGNGNRIFITWDEVNDRNRFRELAKWRGDFALFALDHNVGCYFEDEQARAYWLGEESHYDVEHFFYITNVPGYQNEKIAFQLRVSNHMSVDKRWENTHFNYKADFCFNLIFNEHNRDNAQGKLTDDDLKRRQAQRTKITTIDCICNYYKMGGEERKRIDEFVNAITSGKQPTISYGDIQRLFVGGYRTVRDNGRPAVDIRSSGPGTTARRENFLKRDNFTIERPYFPWKGEEEEIRQKEKAEREAKKKELEAYASNEIPYSVVANLSNGEVFSYEDAQYRLNTEQECAQLVKPGGKSKRTGEPIYHEVAGMRRRISFPPLRDVAEEVCNEKGFDATFKYKGEEYCFVVTDDNVFAVKSSMANNFNQSIADGKNAVLLESHTSVKITMQDIMEMVTKALKRLIY